MSKYLRKKWASGISEAVERKAGRKRIERFQEAADLKRLGAQCEKLLTMKPLLMPLNESGIPKAGVAVVTEPNGTNHHLVWSASLRKRLPFVLARRRGKSHIADDIARQRTGLITRDYRKNGTFTLKSLRAYNLPFKKARMQAFREFSKFRVRFIEETDSLGLTLLRDYLNGYLECAPKRFRLSKLS